MCATRGRGTTRLAIIARSITLPRLSTTMASSIVRTQSPTPLGIRAIVILLCRPLVPRRFCVPLFAANVVSDRWRLFECSRGGCYRALVVDKHDHPDANGAAVAEEWRAVDPAWTALAFAIFVGACKPPDFGSDATAFAKCCAQVCANAAAAADAVEEG